MERASRATHRRFTIASIAVLLIAALAVPAGAGVPPCRVTNLTTGQVYDGAGGNLQVAVNQAAPGTHLRIRGICSGTFSVGKRLRLIGVSTSGFPVPTLRGNGAASVLTVGNAIVVIDDLTIRNGGGDAGGGIDNAGDLTLTGTTEVTMNDAFDAMGGGVYNGGTLTLRRSASVTANEGGRGGGVFNDGVLELFGGSSISGNDASAGGGVNNSAGAITRLHGTSTIANNDVLFSGGGVDNAGRLVLHDRSSIRGNRATVDFSEGGGISNGGVVIMNDASSLVGNTAGDSGHGETFGGGGIINGGTLTMRHSSTIRNNSAFPNSIGGGVTNLETMTMRGQSSVRGNTSGADGGGIYNMEGTVSMFGGSTVRGNTAAFDGGGIFNVPGTLIGAVAGSNVVNNVPNDIAM